MTMERMTRTIGLWRKRMSQTLIFLALHVLQPLLIRSLYDIRNDGTNENDMTICNVKCLLFVCAVFKS